MKHLTLDLDSLEVTTFDPAFSGDAEELARPSVEAPCTWEFNSCYAACISMYFDAEGNCLAFTR